MTKQLLTIFFIFSNLILNCTTFSLRAKKKQVRITVVGDIMCHSSQLNSYYNPKTKNYDTSRSFELIRNRFEQSDLVLGNLETTLVKNPSDYSGYPRFGSPIDLATSLKNAGFHVLSTANNHSADKGSPGIDITIETVRKENMVPIGSYQSQQDYDLRRHFSVIKNNLKIAIYNYTYSTNGIKVPDGRIVRLIDEKTITEDMEHAKSIGMDLIIVWFHFGTEYQIKPDASQLRWVNFALNLGADVILGGHPHVVQRIDKINDQLVAYSLGNFLSAQNHPFTDGGIILNFNFSIDGNGQKLITDVAYESVWIYPHGYQIIPINEIDRENFKIPLNKHYRKKASDYKMQFDKVMSENKL
ncbi:CapA family protein [Leptospira ognonensis]|uniref:CapA family protein n=1 Tax=Leptospira ognonensis TaxID=2484945 RepID=UPI001FE9E026|nr:CapA family protein [Leptospira ognonensis]